MSDRNLDRLHRSLDYHGVDPNVLVQIPSENVAVNSSVCRNEEKFANHSCSPNARLVGVGLLGKTLIFICAIRRLQAGEEVFIDYERYSDRPGSPQTVSCLCRSRNYRLAI